MTRQIRLQDTGAYVASQMEKLLRAAVLETDSLLKQASPVDTARFRLSWAIGENAAPFPGKPPGDYHGSDAPPLAVNYELGQEKLGNIYSVHNNLPYAEPLANGHSPQATPGWVQGIAKDVQGRVSTAAAKIGRES